jgi:hypothetical protein
MVEYIKTEESVINGVYKKDYNLAINGLKTLKNSHGVIISKQFIVNRLVIDKEISREYALLLANNFIKRASMPLKNEIKRLKIKGIDPNKVNLSPIVSIGYKYDAVGNICTYIATNRVQYKAQKNRYKIKTFNFLEVI